MQMCAFIKIDCSTSQTEHHLSSFLHLAPSLHLKSLLYPLEHLFQRQKDFLQECVREPGEGHVFSLFRQICPNLWGQIGFSSKRAYFPFNPGKQVTGRGASCKLLTVCGWNCQTSGILAIERKMTLDSFRGFTNLSILILFLQTQNSPLLFQHIVDL